MTLSIITINYNDSIGLEKTILSVINQTYNNFEYIVIDGNSTDNSKNILLKYQNHITKWVSEKDRGIYNAMNKGASYATGDYLLFLNSGDYLFDKNSLFNLFQYKFSEDIVSCGLKTFNAKEQFIQRPPKNISLFTFYGGSLPHPSTLIRRELFNQCKGYSENYKIISDWCFFVEALIINNCSYRTIPIILSVFNCFGISSNNQNTSGKEMLYYLEKRFPRIVNDYIPTKDEALSNTIYWISSLHGITKKIIILPFKIINRVLHLRNKLSKRIFVKRIK